MRKEHLKCPNGLLFTEIRNVVRRTKNLPVLAVEPSGKVAIQKDPLTHSVPVLPAQGRPFPIRIGITTGVFLDMIERRWSLWPRSQRRRSQVASKIKTVRNNFIVSVWGRVTLASPNLNRKVGQKCSGYLD